MSKLYKGVDKIDKDMYRAIFRRNNVCYMGPNIEEFEEKYK